MNARYVITTNSSFVQELVHVFVQLFFEDVDHTKPLQPTRCSNIFCWRRAWYSLHLAFAKPLLLCEKCGDKIYHDLAHYTSQLTFAKQPPR